MTITFRAELLKIGSRKVIKIPLSSSQQLPSRGMVMVEGTINDIAFIAPLEPDGKGSHWLNVSSDLLEVMGKDIGDSLFLEIEPIDEWIEPEIPEDVKEAIMKMGLMDQWNSITTKARWDWIRWIRSTANRETRNKRIEAACSKLQKGDKRPCCFDRTRNTITDVSKSGVLLDK